MRLFITLDPLTSLFSLNINLLLPFTTPYSRQTSINLNVPVSLPLRISVRVVAVLLDGTTIAHPLTLFTFPIGGA